MFFWSVSVSQPNSLEAQIIFEKDRFHFSSDASTEGEEIQKQRADGKRSPQKRRVISVAVLIRLFDVINLRAIIDFFSSRCWK